MVVRREERTRWGALSLCASHYIRFRPPLTLLTNNTKLSSDDCGLEGAIFFCAMVTGSGTVTITVTITVTAISGATLCGGLG